MKKNNLQPATKIAVFRGRKVRRTIHKNEWWFSVVDVVEALTDSVKPRVYWNAMKTRVKSQDGIELSTICRQLKLLANDGKRTAGEVNCFQRKLYKKPQNKKLLNNKK